MALKFALEKQVAIAAVQRACRLTSSVFNKLVTSETVTKNDKSPVTGMFTPQTIRSIFDDIRFSCRLFSSSGDQYHYIQRVPK